LESLRTAALQKYLELLVCSDKHLQLKALGSLAAHTTGVRGVMLSGDATGATSGTLSAANKNIHLDSGTQMVLGVAAEK